MVFPETILRDQLLKAKSQSPTSTGFLLGAISDRNPLSEGFIQDINQLVADSDGIIFVKRVMPLLAPWKIQKFLDLIKGDFATLWTIKQKEKRPESTISAFMEQIKLGTRLDDIALRILMEQLHFPDVAISELVEWLKDTRLFQHADQILGK